MISKEVINAMIDVIDENIQLIEDIRSQGFESFSKSFRDIQAAKHSLQEPACPQIWEDRHETAFYYCFRRPERHPGLCKKYFNLYFIT
jgi:hypothetical protein